MHSLPTMAYSIVRGGKPARSASAIVAITESGQHLLKITGYSRTKDDVPTGNYVTSRSFRVGGHSWHIRYYPNGLNSNWSSYIAIYLELDHNVPDGVRAQYTFSLLDHGGKPVPQFTMTSGDEVKVFRYPSLAWGYGSFIKRDELEKSEHLRDDCFTIRCDFTVMKGIHTKDIDVDAAGAARPPPPVVVVPPPDLHRHLAGLLESGEGADVAFEVNGKTFQAHRIVLAARSPALLHALAKENDDADSAAVIRIEDMEAQDFEGFLHYVYTDTLPETTTTAAMLPDLVAAANRYKMERLRLLCENKLCEFMNARTVAVMLAFAGEHHCHGLKEACLRFFDDPANLREVVKVDGFKHLSETCPSLLMELIAKLVAGLGSTV